MEERMRFVRGGFFDGLGDYSMERPIKMFNRDLLYPVQETLPEMGFDYSSGIRVRSGRFFEILSQGIYGGRFKEPQEVNGNNEEDLFSEPDLVDPYESSFIFREVKSFSPDNTLKFYDVQMDKYVGLQLKDFKIPPTIRFELFRHGIKRIQKTYKPSDLHKLVEDLSHNVRFMISIPFSVAYAIYDNASIPYDIVPSPFPFTSRYEGEAYSWCTQFRPRGINNLLAYPEETFEKLGLDPGSYDFIKSKFPRNILMNGNRVTPFPILIVKEIDSVAELRNLEDRVKERFERMDESHPGYKSAFLGGTEHDEEVEKIEPEEIIPGWDF